MQVRLKTHRLALYTILDLDLNAQVPLLELLSQTQKIKYNHSDNKRFPPNLAFVSGFWASHISRKWLDPRTLLLSQDAFFDERSTQCLLLSDYGQCKAIKLFRAHGMKVEINAPSFCVSQIGGIIDPVGGPAKSRASLPGCLDRNQ